MDISMEDIKNKNRYISVKIKEELLKKQSNKCANNPDIPAIGLVGYNCPLWICYDGDFDQAGVQYDHIVEHSDGGANNINNLQALCPSCHAVKTKRYVSQKKPKYLAKLNSVDLHKGRAYMDIEDDNKISSKKRKTT